MGDGRMGLRILTLLAMLAATLGLAAGGASSATAPKVTLTVAVHGSGKVVSRPAGISCPGACTLRVRKGVRVTLTATPGSGYTLRGWANSCAGTATARCTLTLERSQVVGVSFKAPPPLPPPPPPPPPAVAGHYMGTYSDGTFIEFDVLPSGISVANFDFDFDGECGAYGTSFGESGGPAGPFAIGTDGSFQAAAPFTPSNSTGTVKITGKFASDGSAGGDASITFTFTSGDAQGTTCTSSGTWTAHVKP